MAFRRWVVGLVAITMTCFAQKPDRQAVERGRKQFEQACGFCHGNDATGARGPDLIRSKMVNIDRAGLLIGSVIRNGSVDKGMPAFDYTKEQISDLAAFLHYRIQAALDSAHVPGDYPLKKLLTGNADAGKGYFSEHCVQCHSPTGDLAGIARRYTPINLEARFLYPGGKQRSVTITLPSGGQVSGTLAQIDEFNVALRDSSGWYRSWPRSSVKVEVHDPLEQHRVLLSQYTDADVHNLFAYLETLK